jgi:flap endonuclease-1
LLYLFIYFFFPSGDAEEIDKFNRRLVKVTKHHADECKHLLSLMGVPYIEVSSGLKIVIIQSIASNKKEATY